MMAKTNSLILAILGMFLLFACKRPKEAFNSDKWKAVRGEAIMDDTRESMVDDLINSDTLIGLDQRQVVELLGEPERVEHNRVIYLVREKYGSDIDPDYIAYLRIKLDSLGLVTKCDFKQIDGT